MTAAVDGASVLVVEAETHRCGFPFGAIVELLRMVAVVPVPGAPAVIEGIIDVRGTVVPVLDLRARLGLARRAARCSDHLVLINTDQRLIAVHVDRVVNLVPPGNVDDAFVLGANGARHLEGVSRQTDGLLVVLDVDTFLCADESADLDAALDELDAARVDPVVARS